MSPRRVIAPRTPAVAAVLLAFWLVPHAALAAPPRAPWTQGAQSGEVLAEIRIHGNYATPDVDVLRIAQLTVGQPMTPSTIADAKARLEASGRFLAVDIRKRYRSLEANAEVALVVIVQEHPVPEGTPWVLQPLRRTIGSAMLLPILRFEDGYGFTYGGRVSFVDGLGRDARLSVPLTWGGDKAARVEFDKDIGVAPFDHLAAAVSLSRRTNPHVDIDDDRREVSVAASRRIGSAVRAGVHAGLSHIGFGAQDDRMTSYGVDLTVDTRRDPGFPRNAVQAVAGVERLAFTSGPDVNRYRVDARGYVGLVGQTVLAVRGFYATAVGGPLPDYERFLLGGASTLRGYRTGTFIGDTLAVGSVEVRVPLGSAMSVAHYGVTAFADAGTVADRGTRLADARVRTGYGAGVFVLATVFQLKVDVGVRGEGGGVRVHVTSGFQF